jgi:hypothetical protein
MIPTVSVDIKPAKDYLNRLTKRELPRVIGRSLDRTAASGKTFLSRSLRERLALKKAVVDKGISKRRSSEIQNITALNLGRAWFEIRASGKPIPLKDYGARATARRGVTYQVSRKAGRRTYRAKGNLAFIVERFGSHVFVRTGPNPPGPRGAPIRKVFGPSLPQTFRTKRERNALIAHCEQVWATEIIRNARFALSRR